MTNAHTCRPDLTDLIEQLVENIGYSITCGAGETACYQAAIRNFNKNKLTLEECQEAMTYDLCAVDANGAEPVACALQWRWELLDQTPSA